MFDVETRNIALLLAGVIDFCNQSETVQYQHKHEASEHIKGIRDSAYKALTEIWKYASDDDKTRCIRVLKNSIVSIIPANKHDPDVCIVSKPDLDLILKDGGIECCYCEKSSKEAHTCKLRKALVRCGYLSDRNGECPRKGI